MNSKITHLRCGKIIRQLHRPETETADEVPQRDTVYKSINKAKAASRELPFGTLRVVDFFPKEQ